jgi:hypothetical protein
MFVVRLVCRGVDATDRCALAIAGARTRKRYGVDIALIADAKN